MKKIFGYVVLAALVFFLVQKIYVEVFRQTDAPGRSGMPAQAVQVQPVRIATLYHTAQLTGSLRAENEFILAPKVSGRLDKLYVDIGDQVRKGDVIARLDNEEYQRQVQVAQAELEVARAGLGESASELEVSRRELDRALRLAASDSLSQSELDQVQANFDVRQARHEVAQAQVRQKQAALEAARIRLSYTIIRATWEGGAEARRIGQKFANQGAMLQANEPIVSIITSKNLIAVVNVIERDFPFIRTGQTARIRADAYPDQSFEGQVIRFSPVLDEASRQGRVEVLVPNPDGILAPGMFARVSIRFSEHPDVTAVPAEALARRQGYQGVFMVDEQSMQASFVPVTVGLVDGGLAEIREPDLEGVVVTLGQHLLEDGMQVIIPEQHPRQEAVQN
ncbi:efflux RND transporter periplasmic adaptor subunit [Desulfonatronovibrio hydrogenovorans]|uniref:efflux RND transporter periplasmic adaptor subunit n=1 Tax=Desulfonatronovibrio hydrogenovorans TaxID=53245 RepID=UPI00048C41F8|nr:efflux RND transporter periplasmic adaptor subunit [Desulfonatronovibrio hydrogenovorans]